MNTWKSAVVGDLIESIKTWDPSRTNTNKAFSYIDLGAVDQQQKVIVGARELLAAEAPSRARQLVSKDDVLISTVRPNLNGVASVPDHLDGATASTGFCVLRARRTLLNPAYLFEWVKSPEFVSDMTRKATGASYPAISDKIIFESRIPLPPLADQERIARILSTSESLRAKRRTARATLDNLAQATFSHFFGNQSEILGKWRTKKLGELLDFLTSGSRGWAAHYADAGEIFLRIQNVKRNELILDDVIHVNAPRGAEADRTKVQPGDVLLSITADLGRTAVIPEGLGTAYINQHLSILRTKSISPRFLSAYLASPSGQQQIASRNREAVKAGLNFDDIRSLIIPVPPLKKQRAFTSSLALVESLKETNRNSLTKLNDLFSSLQDLAFRGAL